MTKYKCLKAFQVDKYGDDGELLDETIEIAEGTVWQVEESPYNSVVSNEGIRLLGTGKVYGCWLEIYPDNLNEHFIEYKLDKQFNELTDKFGYNKGTLIFHGMPVDEVMALSDKDAEGSVEAMSSFM